MIPLRNLAKPWIDLHSIMRSPDYGNDCKMTSTRTPDTNPALHTVYHGLVISYGSVKQHRFVKLSVRHLQASLGAHPLAAPLAEGTTLAIQAIVHEQLPRTGKRDDLATLSRCNT